MLGDDAACARTDYPRSTLVRHARGARAAVNAGTGANGGQSQATGKTQRIQIAAAPIPHRSKVSLGSGCACERLALHEFDRRAATAQLFHG
jgi:hypothetical protein